MKNHLLFLVLLLPTALIAQNLVPNPSFEEYTNCPDYYAQMHYVVGWELSVQTDKYTGSCYFNACANGIKSNKYYLSHYEDIKNGEPYNAVGPFGVPWHEGIYQCAHSGDAYISYAMGTTALQCKLFEPLMKDSIYNIRLFVCENIKEEYTVGRVAVAFSRNVINDCESVSKCAYVKLRQDDDFIPANSQWTKVCGTYKAMGGEQFFLISTFNDYNYLVKKVSTGKSFLANAKIGTEYYIDDVSVSLKQNSNDFPDTYIDAGCPIELQNIFFETGKSELLPASFPELDKLSALLKNDDSITIIIYGYTDNIGTPEDNLLLSEERAKSVVVYLKSAGIAPERLGWKGFGDTRPIADNNTETGRAKNRRVEFQIK